MKQFVTCINRKETRLDGCGRLNELRLGLRRCRTRGRAGVRTREVVDVGHYRGDQAHEHLELEVGELDRK